MHKNLATWDRTLRVLGALGAGACALMGPFSPAVRLGVFGLTGVYLLATALFGSCLGYRLMGRSTCPVGQRT